MPNSVRQFHQAFGLDAPSFPTPPGRALAALRLRLIKEEMAEVEADFARLLGLLGSPAPRTDEVVRALQPLIKELCDLKYVIDGTFVAFGVDDGPFAEVHRSNMSKLGVDGKPLYRQDGKVLKGPHYSPADPNKMFPPIITIPEEDVTTND